MYIYFTNQAKSELKAKSEESDMPYLRLGVKSGGCSGLEYQMDLTDKVEENDRIDESKFENLDLIVDPRSYIYLREVTVDWEEDGLNSGFSFNNPNAKSTCGCGTSFQPG